MTMTKSQEFLEQAPQGQYWRHAPTVKFSDTPCEAGKPYEGLGAHTRPVLQQLGYDATAISRLAEARVIGPDPSENDIRQSR